MNRSVSSRSGATYSRSSSPRSSCCSTAAADAPSSDEFWNAAHDVLSGRAKAPDALKRLDTTLNRLARGGKWE